MHKGKRYDREQFRELLRQQMDAARNDPTHPYNDRAHPQHAAAVADMRNGYRWLSGEVNEAEEYELAAATNEAIRGETEVATSEQMKPELQAVREMNKIASTSEGRIALQRARLEQPLTPQQKQLWEIYSELEAGVNTVAGTNRRQRAAP
jgi:hypothetical protein